MLAAVAGVAKAHAAILARVRLHACVYTQMSLEIARARKCSITMAAGVFAI